MKLGAFFTTGQVAEMCKISPRTVSKWFDSGRIEGYRVPGSKYRRIYRSSLIHFFRAYGMERFVAQLFSPEVLLVGCVIETDVRSAHCSSLFSAGLILSDARPTIVVFDASIGRADCLEAGKEILKHGLTMCLAALISEDDAPLGWYRAGFSAVFKKPINPRKLEDWLRTACAGGPDVA